MIVVRQCLDPTVTGLNWETTGEAFCRKHLVPVSLAVRLSVLQEERTVAKQLSAVRANEALRVEMLSDGVQTVALEDHKSRTI